MADDAHLCEILCEHPGCTVPAAWRCENSMCRRLVCASHGQMIGWGDRDGWRCLKCWEAVIVHHPQLGWISLSDPLRSLGVTCQEGVEYLYYRGADTNEFRVPKKVNWALLHLVLDDAERRAKDREGE
jgi:hypothetical protein